MSREKSSSNRRRWKLDDSRAVGSIIEQLKHSSYSCVDETVDQPESISTAGRKNRQTSDSNSGLRSKQISDESENGGNSDNLTYTKYDSELNKKNVESPINSVLKVAEYLTRHEKRESDSPDNNEEIRQKERKQKKQLQENQRNEDDEIYEKVGRLDERRESGTSDNNLVTRLEHRQSVEREERTRDLESNERVEDDTCDEDGRSSEVRESESPENNLAIREKRRKAKREGKEIIRVLKSNGTLDDDDALDEDGRSTEIRESESPENNLVMRKKRRKSKKERKEKSRVVESNGTLEVDALEEDGRSTEIRESESPENNLVTRRKRRKSKKERKERSRIVESNGAVEDDAYDEDGRSTERHKGSPEKREKRRKSRKRRKSESRISGSNKTPGTDAYDKDVRAKSKKLHQDGARISRRRKRRRSKGDSSGRVEREEEELPITEILRKAQESSRNRYEELVPLPELKTDTIYVQRRNGFSAVKITGDRNTKGRRLSPSQMSTLCPIKVAIAAQKVWNNTGLIHQGLLAGMALMHLLLIQQFFELSLDFLVDYSLISELYTNMFSFLVTMCVVSVFDKFDLAHLDLEHLREIYVDHSRSFLAVPLYMATFSLHQATLLVDDTISLLNYAGNATGFENNSTETIVEEHLVTWQKVTLAKDGLAVIAWLFVALGPREDMFLTHLKTMEKYADTPESSRRNIVETLEGRIGKR